MKKRLGNNKGYILIFSLIIVIFLTAFGGMIFLKSVSEKLNAQKFYNYIKAGYAAEQGINSVMYEIISHKNWATHDAVDTDPPNKLEFVLNSKYPGQVAPVTAGLGEIEIAEGQTYGCYVKKNTDGTPFFAVKVYVDPLSVTGGGYSQPQAEQVILSRGFSGDVSRLSVTKFSSRSLYDFFIFTPFDYNFGWKTYDASGGAIHSNGSFVLLEDAKVKNFSELSTPLAIKYAAKSFVPAGNCIMNPGPTQNAGNCGGFANGTPWEQVYFDWRAPKTAPNKGTINGYWGYENAYINMSDGHLYGDTYGIKMEYPAGTYTEWNPVVCPTCTPLIPEQRPDLYFVPEEDPQAGTYYPVVFANDKAGDGIENFSITVPNRMSGSYQWNIFDDAKNRFGYSIESEHPVNYTNSVLLPSGWQTFISANPPLADLIKEANTDGEAITPLQINSATYESDALSNGIVITKGHLEGACEEDSPYAAIINGATYCADSDGRIAEEGSEDWPLMERKTFWNTSTANQDTVIAIDMPMLYGYAPNNGILYSNQNILLYDSMGMSILPDNGLTILSTNNLYLKGNFNSVPEDWQRPAAAIVAGDIYLLSDNFNFPQTLPATIHNPDYPDVPDVGWLGPDSPYLPNKAANTTYNISLIGFRGHEPRALERWSWDGGAASINVKGSFIQLEPENFPGDFVPENNVINKVRCANEGPYDCAYAGHCYRNCAQYNRYFTFDMTSRIPGSSRLSLRYDEKYLDPSNPRPPGDLHGFSQRAQLEIDNSDYNFTHHYMSIY